jgi:hypothetical protein
MLDIPVSPSVSCQAKGKRLQIAVKEDAKGVDRGICLAFRAKDYEPPEERLSRRDMRKYAVLDLKTGPETRPVC